MAPSAGMTSHEDIDEIDACESESLTSDVEIDHVETPVSALSDVHQRGLRAVSLHQILRRGGKLAGPKLRKEDYSCSRELVIMQIEYFISHNWQVDRWRKFVTLATHFNMYKAVASSAAAGLILGALVIAGVLPVFMVEAEVGEDLVTTPISVWCTLGSLVALLLALTLSHDVLLCLGRQGPDVFLDKVCVDQFDDQKKQEGIHAITSYLWNSDALVVVLSEMYLERIWTVFELVSFLVLKPYGKVHALPVELATFTILMAVCQSLRIMGELINSYFAPVVHPGAMAMGWIIGSILLFLLCCAMILPVRRWGRVRSQLSQQMDTFTFASSHCQQEADREEIMGALVNLAVEHKIVKEETRSTKEVCEILEARAREVVPKSMQEEISWGGLPRGSVLIFFTPLIASELDPIVAEISMGQHDANYVFFHLLHVLLVAFSWPWFMSVVGYCLCFGRKRCLYEALIISLAGLVLGGFLFAGRVVRNLGQSVEPSGGYIAVMSLLLAFEVGLFWAILWQPACLQGLGCPLAKAAEYKTSAK